MKKKFSSTKRIENRRAKFDYQLGDSYIVGLQLSGRETKSLRMGHGHIKGAYVTIKDNELWLINATITGVAGINISENEQTRSRKLLLKRKEINQLMRAKQQGMSIIPLELIISGRYIKLKIATGRGKKLYDKRQIMKARDEKRKIGQALKSQ